MRIASCRAHDPEPIAIIGKDDPLSIRRKFGRVERTDLVRQSLQSISIDADGVNLKRATLVGGKIYCLTVRGERGIKSRSRKVCQLFSPGPIGVHDADLVDLVDVTGEHNLAGGASRTTEIRNESR